MYDPKYGLRGFADGKPSEAIQRHTLGCISVSVVIPYKPDTELLDIPVKQYKDVAGVSRKINAAKRLQDWLDKQREEGLTLTGSINVHTQATAAKLGLRLIEEMPNTEVVQHYDSYRLVCNDIVVNLAEAVALQYYHFCINNGILRAAMRLPDGFSKLTILMDRFGGNSSKGLLPGQPVPLTNSSKFVHFAFNNAPTWIAIREENIKSGFDIKIGHLEWWHKGDNKLKKGKTHPHFILPDWINATAVATHFRDNFIEDIDKGSAAKRNELADNLNLLYEAFRRYDFWSYGEKVPGYIVGTNQAFEVSEEAKTWLMNRANNIP